MTSVLFIYDCLPGYRSIVARVSCDSGFYLG